MEFQSTLPARGATGQDGGCRLRGRISIHAPRTGSDILTTFRAYDRSISIHAPRTGSDGACRWRLDSPAHFNPRSPHGERHIAEIIITVWVLFQSTLPARGATVAALSEKSGISFQSTLPARGATNWDDINKAYSEYISIHAPRTGSDQRQMADVPQLPSISIHAPRTGSDAAETWQYAHTRNFNPRSPHGERP